MRKFVSWSVRGFLFGALFVSLAWVSVSATPRQAASSMVPSFSAVSLDGQSIGSARLAGSTYIVNFFASWCPPCRAEIPDMVALQAKYGRRGFTFVGVAVNESESNSRDFISRNKIGYPVVIADAKLMSAFGRYVDGGIQAIPTSFVVDSSGRIIRVLVGAQSKEVFEKVILDALGRKSKKI